MFSKRVSHLALVMLMTAAFSTATVSAAAEVFIVHGIPGTDLGLDPDLPVDISVNGDCVLTGFAFGEIFGPVGLEAGTYDIAIALANPDDPCGNEPVIIVNDLVLEDGTSYAIAAHLTESGDPTASAFEVDLSLAFLSRLIAHHTAAAPSVDIVLERDNGDDPLVIEDFANGEQAEANVFPGEWQVTVFPAGDETPLFGPVELELAPATGYLVFAVGSLTNETFDLLVFPEPLLGCLGDVNLDGQRDLTDLAILLSNYGGPGGPADGDITGDGQVCLIDLAILLAFYGQPCP